MILYEFKEIWFVEKEKGQVWGLAAIPLSSSRGHQMNGIMKKRDLWMVYLMLLLKLELLLLQLSSYVGGGSEN